MTELLPVSYHVDELRQLLLKTLVVFLLAAGTAFCFHEPLLATLMHWASPVSSSAIKEQPLLLNEYTNHGKEPIQVKIEGKIFPNEEIKGNTQLLQPGQQVLVLTPRPPLALFSPLEGVLSVMKLSFYAGILVCLPYALFNALKYIGPALPPLKALRLFRLFLFLWLFLGIGTLAALFITLPLANNYFYAFNESLGMNLWGLSGYIDFIFGLIFAHGFLFQIAGALLLAVHYGILKKEHLEKKRPHAFVGALILGAILTPPDVMTQLFAAVPLYLLFEFILMYSRFTLPSREPSHAGHVHPNKDATHRQEP